ncbi:alpha/beta-hydrolase [Mycena leptocephala]|nr:alpha/beta-hydrolase [Mycena leptocephala]
MVSVHLLSRVCATVLLTAPLAWAQTSAPIIDLGYARYQGEVNTANNITHYLGIRYAAPPLGDLRFRAPRPPLKMTGVQPATTQPNECFQGSTGQAPINPLETRATQIIDTEDCLFLNVYYPSNGSGAPPAGLPTLVFIHGGGYISGSATAFGENGEDLVRDSDRGMVVVLIQYRLGLFGKSQLHYILNLLLTSDRRISKFGGDPSKVTIWGESAGAGSVLQQVIAHGGKTEPQLFRAAITSSTFLPSQYLFNDTVPEFLFSEVLAQANCTTAADSLACLRAADATVLATVNANISLAADDIIQEPPVNGEALLAVTNAFEGTIFVNSNVVVNATQYSLELFPKFSTRQANAVGALYANVGDELFQGEFAVPPGLHGNDLPYYFQTAEMLFNKTAAGVPVVEPILTSDALLQRCQFWETVGSLTGQ